MLYTNIFNSHSSLKQRTKELFIPINTIKFFYDFLRHTSKRFGLQFLVVLMDPVFTRGCC